MYYYCRVYTVNLEQLLSNDDVMSGHCATIRGYMTSVCERSCAESDALGCACIKSIALVNHLMVTDLSAALHVSLINDKTMVC